MAMQKQFGPYIVVEEIARGGMGIVYQAKDETTGQIVALKVMLAGSQANLDQIKRFVREADLGLKLDHPNIVKILHAGEEAGYPYFAMQYIEGGNFQDMIAQQAPLRTILTILVKVAKALSAAHQKKVIHRDLKPSNILIDKQGEPYLTDFGLAKSLDKKTMTQSGEMLGTPFYMSPEQIDGQRINHVSDLYALGVILYQCLTGKLPFVGSTLPELYCQIMEKEPTLPRKLNAQISPQLEAICLKAMDKNPAGRYQDALQFASDLDDYLKHRRVTRKISRTFWLRRLWREYKKTIAWSASGLAVIVTCVSLALFFKPAPVKSATIIKKQTPQQKEAVARKAQSLLDGRHYDQALTVLEENIQVYGPSVEICRAQGQVYEAQQNWPLAYAAFSKVIELEPTPENYYGRAHVMASAGYYDQTQSDLEKAQGAWSKKRISERNLGLQNKLEELKARIALQKGNYFEAHQLYQKILQKTEISPQTYLNAGLAAYHVGEYHLAIASFQKALRQTVILEEDEYKLLLYRGISYRQLQEPKKAIGDLEAIVDKSNPEMGKAQANLGAAYLQLQNYEMAYRWLNQAKATAPDLPLVSESLGGYYLDQNQHHEALACFDKCIELVPWESQYFHKRGMALLKLQRHEAALKCFKHALEMNPGDIRPVIELMISIFDQGAMEEISYLGVISLSYMLRYYKSVDDFDIFRDQMETLNQQYRELSYQEMKQKSMGHETDFSKLFSLLVAPPTEDIPPIAIEALASLYHKEEVVQMLQTKLSELSKNAQKNKPAIGRLQELQAQMDQKIVQAKKREMKRRLIRMMVGKELETLYELDRMGESAVELLGEIVRDTREDMLVRFLACQGLLAWGHYSAFQTIQHYMTKAPDPESALLCAAALKKKGFDVEEQMFTNGLKLPNPFLRALAGRYLDLKYWDELSPLLQDEDEKVQMLVAGRLEAKMPEPCRQILARGCASTNPLIRIYSLSRLWPFQNPFQQNKIDIPRHLLPYLPLIKKGLQDSNTLMKRVAASRIGMYQIHDLAKDTIRLFEDSDPLVQYLAINAVAFLGSKNDAVWKVLFDPHQPQLLRAAVLPALLRGCDLATLQKIQAIVKEKDSHLGALIVLFSGSMGAFLGLDVGILVRQYFTNPDPCIRMSACASALFSRKTSLIPAVSKLIKDESLLVQKAAAAATAQLSLYDKADKIAKSHQQWKTKAANLQAGAAFGYYYPLMGKVLTTLMHASGEMVVASGNLEAYEYFRYRDFLNFIFEEYFLKEYRSFSQNNEKRQMYLDYLNYAIELQPTAFYYYRRAMLQDVCGLTDPAIRDMEHTLQEEPHATLYLAAYVKLLAKKQDYDLLHKTARRLIELDPRSLEGWYFLGYAYWQTEKMAEALDAYRHAYVLSPQNLQTLQSLGEALFATQQYQEALPILQAAIKQIRKNRKLALLITLCYQRLHQSLQARQYWNDHSDNVKFQDTELAQYPELKSLME